MAQQQADALALLAETALHHELDPGAPRGRYQVLVHVDLQCWRTRISPASPSSRTGRTTFPQKRRGAWRAMRAGW
jgi:hypothetical protein